MKTLYIHIGHDKTGSSFIQSALANSEQILADAGIDYPMLPPMRFARNGLVTSGNQALFSELFVSDTPQRSRLYSSEIIFQNIFLELLKEEGEKPYTSNLAKVIEGKLFDKTKILIFIRNQVDLVCSKYQQQIKHSGIYHSVEDFFDGIMPQTRRVRAVMEYFLELKNCELSVVNYSYTANPLEVIERWLEIPIALNPPKNTKVNRSLTKPELLLQMAFNKRFGRAAYFLSDMLVNNLPSEKPARISPAISHQQAYLERCREDMEWINSRVSPEHRYQIDLIEPEPLQTTEGLSEKQYDILAEWVEEFANKLAEEKWKQQLEAMQANDSAKNSIFHRISAFLKRKRK
jgi:hypothetical protein